MKIFSGSANKPLSEKIAQALGINISSLEIHVFPDGEKRVRVEDSVIDEECIVVQPTSSPADINYMELFFIIDAIKRSGAKSVTVVIPYLGYQRQDHVFRSGEAVSLDVVAKTLEAAGVDKIITFDLHSIKIPEVFNVPVLHLSALPIFAEKIKEISNFCLVSPDMGGIRRIKIISELLDNMPYAVIKKNRDLATGEVAAENIEGEVRKKAIIVDDMISSGKTIEMAAKLLREKGAKEIYVFATHAVFSGDAPRILQNAKAEKVFVSDTIDIPKEKLFPKLEILSVADTIANELQRAYLLELS